MLKPMRQRVLGFGTMMEAPLEERFNSTSDDYAHDQTEVNAAKTRQFILPYLSACGARSVVDIGCGVGAMVETIQQAGYQAYGVDLISLSPYWARLGLDRERFFLVDPYHFRLPFEDDSVDFVFSLGVIEHVGTSNGHSDRLPDYHAIRREWLREVFRVVKPGGQLLLGGPNRNFPVDTAHGPDSRCLAWERYLSGKLGATVHRPWGGNFLWGYADIRAYLEGLPCRILPQSVHGLMNFSRVPGPLRGLARNYVARLPRALLGTGFNPWMLALVEKQAQLGESRV